jgi:phage gp45-like
VSAIDRLYRRVLMMAAPVKITATNDTGPVHRAQVRGFPPETIDNMPVLQIYGLASHAMPGSDGMAIFATGDRSNGVIVATGNQQYRLRGLNAGEVALYDNAGNVVRLASGGNIAITCAGPGNVTLTCPTKVRMVTPRLEVTGDVIDHCDEQEHTAADMRSIYNTHTHGNVQNGGGHTAIPDQLQRVSEA